MRLLSKKSFSIHSTATAMTTQKMTPLPKFPRSLRDIEAKVKTCVEIHTEVGMPEREIEAMQLLDPKYIERKREVNAISSGYDIVQAEIPKVKYN